MLVSKMILLRDYGIFPCLVFRPNTIPRLLGPAFFGFGAYGLGFRFRAPGGSVVIPIG